ncbi:hypothetical protein [Mycolicibacter minnesotensis]
MPIAAEEHLPVPIATKEVVLSMRQEGLLVGGDPEAVESYLTRLRESAGPSARVIEVNKASLGNATALLAAAASLLGQSGKFVELHPDSVKALKADNWIPGTDGFFRMMTRSADNKFLRQLQWRPTTLTPQLQMSVQMVAVQLALKAAIAQVEESVRRVEGKVEAVLQLANANRAGDILGTNVIVSRNVAYLEKHGSLPETDWDAVASLGPALNVTVEQLRNHASRVLKSLDPSLAVQNRAEKLNAAVDQSLIGETLSLLVIAEESLYKWQRLRLARVEATEPEHLPQVIQDARELLAYQLEEDGKLYQRARSVIDACAKTHALDGFRWGSVKQLAHGRDRLRVDLDDFARGRRHQVESWETMDEPGVREAVDAAVELAKPVVNQALTAAGNGLTNLRNFVTRRSEVMEPIVTDPPIPSAEPAE